MRFGVLGPLAVWDGGGTPVRVPEAKVRKLLAALLAHEGRTVSADRLVDELWGDRPPGNPANALQAKVSQLRGVLGRERVLRQPPGYRLLADDTDAVRFGALADRAGRTPDAAERAALLTEALGLWRGRAYADFADEEFARTAGQRLEEQRLAAEEERAAARLELGEHAAVAGELTELVALHPFRERLRALQMRALYLAGRQSEALASYDDLRQRLADELGIAPGPEATALHGAILRQEVEGAAAGRPGRPAAKAVFGTAAGTVAPDRPGAPDRHGAPERPGTHRVPTNLPTPLTGLVGRDAAVDDVVGRLARGRLVTLTGPGGVGKTRLAVEAARRQAGGGFPDGVWLVELAGLRGGPADLAPAVAMVLGLHDDAPSGPVPSGGPAARLATALRDRTALLVLDNCEHVVEAAAALAASLLESAPGLRVLATSQEPLGLTGETVVAVEPLPSPDAVRLFTERAAAAAPGFAPSDADRGAVAEICARLDGIPLALELAATRVRALGVERLAARLTDRFRLLTTGRRGAPARQQTLRAMIDWSWELLGAPERIVLRRLAVHRDGCTLEAAEAVCAGDGVSPEDVLDLVTRLVDRSLVVVVDGPCGPRYRLLESVAAYARERLAELEDLGAVRERHLRYFLALAERAEPRLRGADQREWLDRLDAERANLRAALDAALGREPGCSGEAATEAGVRLATALSWWWLLRGRLDDAVRTLSEVLAASGTAAHPEPAMLRDAFGLLTGEQAAPRTADPWIDDPLRRGRAAWLYALGLFNVGAPVASAELNARALALFEEAEPGPEARWGIAATLALRSVQAVISGDLATVDRAGHRSARIFRELGDRWGALQTVSPLASLAEIKGDYAEAARLQNDGLRIAEDLGLRTEVSARLSGLGRLALLRKDWEQARELHERARKLASDLGYKFGEIHARMGSALGARRSGDLDTAEAELDRIRAWYADVSSEAGNHLLLAELGFVAELRGDAARARTLHLAGLDLALSLADPRTLALSFEGLAGAAALADDGTAAGAGHAARLLGAAARARQSVDAPLPAAERADVDRVTAAARARLGPDGFAAAFTEGAALDPAAAERLARRA
ncbi:BTAD domain-containing putative transcriptional regulator [Streptomyces sp. NPDC060194]|uniref:AfsR/SARP family transcriptional regulator n=1 Tax=Streptomyces sp. NPDC060194 TaxID=3347069 RepID=UPI00365B075E